MLKKKVFRIVCAISFLWNSFMLSAQETCATAVPVPSLTGSPCATATPGTVDNLGPGSCDEGTLDTWFSFTAQGGSATVTVTSTISNWKPEFLIISSSNNGCTGAFTEINCTDGANAPYATINSTTTGLIPGNTYWIVVSSGATNLTTGTLSVCVNNPLVIQNCVDNDACLDAATINLNAPGGAATCLTDCNNGANPGPDFTGNNCEDSPNATVWYEFTTSANTATIDVTLTSSQLSDPEFSIYIGNACTNFSTLDCVEGTAGSASSLGLLVTANTTYLIAVSDVTGDQGTFTLCITQNADNSACNTNSALTVISTSMGSPLTGPFQPGEIVTYQYTITDFTQFNCNYIGAVVPTFGSCWSPSSFNAQGMPLYVSTPLNVNGIIQPCGPGPPCAWSACAGTPSGSWNWFPAGSATYNINGYYPAGTPMPAGWYFLSSYSPATNACTGDPTDPDNTYGDGSFPNCGTNTFDYTLVFSLIAGPSTNCSSGATDCGVTIKTFADGEFGAWNNIGCSGDLPATYPAGFACCTPPTISPLTNQTICSNTATSINLSSNQGASVTYSWTVVAGSNITGAAAGTGTTINQTLVNSGTVAQTAVYTITANNGSCASTTTVTITIQPRPIITNTPLTSAICSGTLATITPTANIPGTTFAWTAAASGPTITGSSSPGTGSISQTLTNTGSTSGTVTYTITPTGPAPSSCQGTPVNFVVTVNPRPTITNTPTTSSICSGNEATITPTANVTGTTYSWTASASTGTITGFSTTGTGAINQTLNNSGTTSGTVTYVITPTGPAPSSCPGTPVNFVVTVNPRPTITNTPTSSTICSGNLASITPTTNVSGTTFTWTASSSIPAITGFTASGSGNINQTLTNSGATSGTVTYSVTPIGPAPLSCPGNPVNFVVTVTPVPTITNSPTTASICSGATATISPTSNVSGTTFTWTATASSGSITGFTSSGSGNINQTLTNSGVLSGTVTYVVTPVGPAPLSCPGTPVNFVVTVLPKPVINLTAQNPSICNASDGAILVGLTTGSSPSGSLSWSGTTTGSIALINITTASPDITGLPAGSYNVTFTDASGCGSIPVAVTLNNPNAPVINPIADTLSCGIPYQLSLASVTGVNLTPALSFWSAPGGPSGGGTQFANGTLFSSGSTVIYVYDNNGSCNSQIQYNVVISAVPAITNASTTQAICSGSTATINLTSSLANTLFNWSATASSASISGFSSNGSGNITQTLSNSGFTAGSVTYVVTPVGPAPTFCVGTPVNFVVSVNPIPQIQNTSTVLSSCSGTSSSIIPTSSVAGTNFSWTAIASSPNITGFNANGTGSINQTLNNTGSTLESVTYSVTPTGPAPTLCVGAPLNFVINVSPRPQITNAITTATVCSGNSFAFQLTSNVSNTSYSWITSASSNALTGFSPNGVGDIAQTVANSGTVAENVTYSVTPSGPPPQSCLGNPLNFVVTVQPTPVINPGSQNTSICSGSIANISPSSSTAGTTFNWSASSNSMNISGFTPSGSGTISQNLTNSGNSSGSVTYVVSPVGPAPTACPGQPVSFTVNVEPIPSVTNSITQYTICSGIEVTIDLQSSTASTSFNWVSNTSSPNITGNTGSGNGNIIQTLSNSGASQENVTYVVTPTGPSPSFCPGLPVNFTVNVDPIPLVTNAVTTVAICSGNSVNFDPLSNVSGTSFEWMSLPSSASISGYSITGNGSISNTLVNSGSTSGTVTYTITPTAPAPSLCEGIPVPFVVTVYSNPQAAITPDPLAICSGETIDINGGAQGGSGVYTQHVWTGDGAVYLNNTGIASPSLTASSGGTYTLIYSVTDNNGCSGTDQLSFDVFTNPLIDAIAPVTACGSYTLMPITGSNLNSPAYWNGSLQSGDQIAVGTAINTSTTLYLYDGASNCFDEDTLQITINPLPELLFLSKGDTYCEGEAISPILVEVSGTPDWTVEFTLDGVNQTVTSSLNSIELGNSPGLYTLSMLTDNFCSNGLDGSATIIVNPLPPAPFTAGDTTYCSNWEPVPLSATGSGGTLSWYADEALTIPASNVPSMQVGATTYYVTETLNGCEGSPSSVTITVENCDIIVPTAFTPDGDDVNDFWEILDLDYVYPENVVFVYNRWGGLIYQSEKGAYSVEPWKGDYQGNPLPVGSYYYVIELNDGKTDPLKGIISLILND